MPKIRRRAPGTAAAPNPTGVAPPAPTALGSNLAVNEMLAARAAGAGPEQAGLQSVPDLAAALGVWGDPHVSEKDGGRWDFTS